MPAIIERNPKVLGGMLVIKGTRIPVSRVVALIGMDYTIREIKEEYPQLKAMTKSEFEEIVNYLSNQISY